jgi:hypothetical protein
LGDVLIGLYRRSEGEDGTDARHQIETSENGVAHTDPIEGAVLLGKHWEQCETGGIQHEVPSPLHKDHDDIKPCGGDVSFAGGCAMRKNAGHAQISSHKW